MIWVGRFPGVPATAGSARRITADVLSTWGHADAADAATLLVSEVVTNAILHAGSEIELRLTTAPHHLRVEVRDTSMLVPALRRYQADAVTGRGLELVETVAAAWGVIPEPDGKVVWFELALDEHVVAPKPAAPSPDGLASLGQPGTQGKVTVHLLGLPLRLVKATLEYGDAVLRELALARCGPTEETTLLVGEPRPLLNLGTVLAAVERGLADGKAQLDVDLAFAPAMSAVALDQLALIDEGDRLAEEEHLLIPPALPEFGTCRRWLLSQIAMQLLGEAPQRWALPDLVDPPASPTADLRPADIDTHIDTGAS